jgi:hypothetical protein
MTLAIMIINLIDHNFDSLQEGRETGASCDACGCLLLVVCYFYYSAQDKKQDRQQRTYTIEVKDEFFEVQ